MARPKGSKNKVPARYNNVTVKFNDDELAEVDKRAKESKLDRAVYIRRRALR